MTPERWQQIDKLFQSVLERPPEERAGFLAEACRGDEAVRSEVEALIVAHEQSGEFLDSPAYEIASGKLANDSAGPVVGETLGRYEVLGPLGAGGMGEVYLAQDTKLGRKIALKLLPQDFTKDTDRVRRFEQEAHAASGLSHPNVCVIHEIGETEDSRRFIAMEYIDGLTLRQRMAQKRMKLGEALDVATQIAAGLGVAHAAGIIHRDIKPENIMIRSDGLVKVLDFGLAKLTARPIVADTQAPTRVLVNTDPGMVMGTVTYMSPEQARRLGVDSRGDIWSLGVVLYEMVAGKPPFAGPTPSDTIVSILERDPSPLSFHKSEVPPELERIVRKALRKDREERYQVVKDLALDLKSLRHDLEAQAGLERSFSPAFSGEAEAATNGGPTASETSSGLPRTAELIASRPTSSAEYLVREIKSHKRGAVIALGGFLISLTLLAFLLNRYIAQNKQTVPLQNLKITRLTTSGKAVDVAISRDGNYVAFVVDDNGKQSLWVRQVASENKSQLVPPTATNYWRPTFSRDGTQVYYVASHGARSALYQVSVLGGTSKKSMDDVGDFTFSPDGRQIAFTQTFFESTDRSLMMANVDGSNVQKLVSRVAPDFILAASWSPDGKVIAFVSGVIGSRQFDLFELRVVDKRERRLTSQNWQLFDRIAWWPDGSSLLITAMVHTSPFFQMWQVSYPSGETKKLIGDLNQYNGLSVAANSSLVTVQSNEVSNVWTASLADPGKAKQITFGAGRYQDLSWTPEGKIVYASDASGHADIWMMEADGSGQKQLTNDPGRSYGPTETPDGRYVVFHSDRTGRWNIWRVNTDGSNPKQLTVGEWATCSPDGSLVIYVAENMLWKIPIEGGTPVQITEKNTSSWAPVVSPKGDLIACLQRSLENSPATTAIIPFEGGKPVRTFAERWAIMTAPAYRWTPDGRALVYINNSNGVSNLWIQPLDGARPKQLTDFKSETFNSFDLSRDGKLAMSRATSTSDVVLISGIN